MASRRGVDRWLGLLVRLFPAPFREELGDEMRATLRAEHAAATADGRRSERWGFWLRNLAGALRTAPREHAEAIALELRQTLRAIARRPLFTLSAAASLAIGIGATTTVAAVASAAFFRPLRGVATPETLVDVKTRSGDGENGLVSYPFFLDLQRTAAPFCELAGFSGLPLSLAASAGAEPERVFGQVVTAGLFPLLGVEPQLGRAFAPEEDVGDGAHPVAVLSAWLWRERFGADPGVLGRPLWLNGRQLTVVGVGPEGFRGHFIGFPMDVFVPSSMAGLGGVERDDRRARWVEMIGRRRAGVDVETVRAGLAVALPALAAAHPEVEPDLELIVAPRHPLEADLRGGAATFLVALAFLAVAVLAVACVNVANLSLTHLAARQGEMALRLALGASRGRLLRLLATETLVLVALAAAGGLALAAWATTAAGRALDGVVDGDHLDIRLDPPALAVALGLSLATALVFGAAPSLRLQGVDLAAVMRRGRGLGAASRLWKGLVVVQVVFSVVVLVSAGLFLRVLQRADRLDPGFRAGGVLATRLDPAQMGLGDDDARAALARILARVEAVPGASAALTDRVQLGLGARFFATPLEVAIPGWQPGPGRDGVAVEHHRVSAAYFDTLSIPLRDGRLFAAGDREGTRRVAVVNESFARRFFPQGAVGRTLRDGDGELAIVGVVADSRYRRLDETPIPYLYLALAQQPQRSATLLVRGVAAPDLLAAIRAEAPHLPVPQARPLPAIVAESLLPQRVAAAVAGGLGLVGLFLTAFGLYGLVAYSAERRRAEVGLRMSLGARPRDVLWMMLRQGLVLTAVGVALGWPLAGALARLARSFLVGLHPADPPTYLAIAALLLAATVLACWGPARRGARVEPSAVLRAE